MFRKSLLMFATAFVVTANAQLTPSWNAALESNINWQEVSSFGNLLVSTPNGLSSVDPETGNVIWNDANLANLDQGEYSELNNSPFAKINRGNTISILNLFTGKEVFNSEKDGFKKVKSEYVLYQSNTLLISGKGMDDKPLLVGVDIDNGEILWKSSEETGKIFRVQELSNTDALLITLFKNVRINSTNGNIVWSAENSQESKQLNSMGAFGDMMKKAAENMTNENDLVLDFSIHPENKYLVMSSEVKEEMSATTSSGEPIIKFKTVYNAYDIKTGDILWSKPIKVNGKLGKMTWLGDNLLVMPNNEEGKSKVNLYDIQTAQGLWGKKGKGITIKGGVVDFTETEKGLVVITSKTKKNFLNYLDTENGVFTFEKDIKIKGFVGYTSLTSKGMLYATHSQLNIIDLNTGEKVWEKDLKASFDLITENAENIYFVNNDGATVNAIKKATSTITMTGKAPFEFQEKEYPEHIELRKDGLFLSSSQNFAKYDFEGDLIFNTYYKSPKEEGWKRALLIAGSIYAGYQSAVTGLYGATVAAAGSELDDNSVEKQLTTELSNKFGEASQQAGSVAKEAMQAANKRFKATVKGQNFVMVMTKTDNGIELIKVNKENGQAEGSIFLGKDRKPNYSVDLVDEKVYLEKEGTMLQCFDLK